jgi:hypothetical protein
MFLNKILDKSIPPYIGYFKYLIICKFHILNDNNIKDFIDVLIVYELSENFLYKNSKQVWHISD